LIAVGERAIRIAERAGGSGYFRAEASAVYMHTALRARAETDERAGAGETGAAD
jgi:hypothetical protein